MWIAFRLILAIIGFVIRQLSRGTTKATDGVYEGIGYFEKLRKTRRGIRGFTIGMERRSPTWLRCHAESSVDRFFKRLGVANEVQTGDERFDDLVYVTCDHPYIQALLVESAQLRDALIQVFEAGYTHVTFNGSTVAIRRATNTLPMPRDLQLLKQLHTASARLEDEIPRRFADPFLWKALVVEGLLWSMIGYAAGAVFESAIHDEDFHVSHDGVVRLGLMVAVIALVMLVGLITLTMRGSSRGHRVIVESAVLLLLALPVSAVQIVSDTNRVLDDAAPMVVSRTYSRCETRAHRSSKSTQYSHHLWLDPVAEGPRLPATIEITRALCNASTPGGDVTLTIGPGRWGLPWYRRIEIENAVWSAPL